jgi:hypothetical protein
MVDLVACGGSDDPRSTLLVGNTRGNNVVSLERKSGAFIKEFISASSGGLSGLATGAGELFAPATAPMPNGGGYVSFLGLSSRALKPRVNEPI